MATPAIIREGFAYRNGPRSMRNLTPRPDKDVSSEPGKAGLSAFQALEDAIKLGARGQKIDLAKLAHPLAAFLEDDGHIGIVPVKSDGSIDVTLLQQWADTRNVDSPHPLAVILDQAIVEADIRRSR